MGILKRSNLILIKVILWGIIALSVMAIVYHIRWFIPFLMNGMQGVVPAGQAPLIWFIVQISNNIIFLFVGILLINLFRKYKKTGYFDEQSLKAFDAVIFSCVALALLAAVQIVSNNFNEVHFDQWTSIASTTNLLFRSLSKLLIFQEPQSMYFLLAIILWAVKQFVTKALIIKSENESFV